MHTVFLVAIDLRILRKKFCFAMSRNQKSLKTECNCPFERFLYNDLFGPGKDSLCEWNVGLVFLIKSTTDFDDALLFPWIYIANYSYYSKFQKKARDMSTCANLTVSFPPNSDIIQCY